jgi:hypothetical protein
LLYSCGTDTHHRKHVTWLLLTVVWIHCASQKIHVMWSLHTVVRCHCACVV